MAITGNFSILGSVANTLGVPENRSGTMYDSIRQTWGFTDGVLGNQNDLVWSDRRNLAAGAFDDLVLSAIGNDVFGNAVVFVTLTGIIVRNTSAGAGDTFTVGSNAGANQFLGPFNVGGIFVTLDPEACYCIWSNIGWAVGAGATDQMRIQNTGGNPANYDILLIGRSV
jgi:hypothetical protein